MRGALLLTGFIVSLDAWPQNDLRDARIQAISGMAARAEMPIMKDEMIPLQAMSRVRILLSEEGQRLALGNEWHPETPEWRDVEKQIQERVKNAIAQPSPPVGKDKLDACLRDMTDADLAAMHEAMQSDVWPHYRNAVDMVGVAFALLGDLHRSLATRQNALFQALTDAGATGSGAMSVVQEKLRRPGTEKCYFIIESSVVETTGVLVRRAIEITEAARPMIADAATRFAARNRR